MRIISGIYKSRTLISPSSYKIRPTADRAKETLFNILNSRISFENIICLDLFCGTGNLGLEAVSRGAKECYFVDIDTKLVQKNIEKLESGDKCKVFMMKATTFLNKFKDIKFTFIFCDPPYDYEQYEKLLSKISLMETKLALEHSDKFSTPPDFQKFVYLRKAIGEINFTFYDFNT